MTPMYDQFGYAVPSVTEWGVQFETRGSNIVQWFRDREAAAVFAEQKGVARESLRRREVEA